MMRTTKNWRRRTKMRVSMKTVVCRRSSTAAATKVVRETSVLLNSMEEAWHRSVELMRLTTTRKSVIVKWTSLGFVAGILRKIWPSLSPW